MIIHEIDSATGTFDFQALFAVAPTPLLAVVPPDFVCVAVSEAYLRAARRRREEVIGRPLFDVLPDDPSDPSATGTRKVRASFERVLATRRADAMELQPYDVPIAPGGAELEERWWSSVNAPLLGAGGEVIAIVHHVEDVTEVVRLRGEKATHDRLVRDQRQAVEELREANADTARAEAALRTSERWRAAEDLHASEEQNRLIIEGARDYAILTTDPEGRILSWSPGAEAIFGWTADEAVGEALAMTFVPEDRASGRPEWELRTAREQGFAPDVRWHQRKDGSRVFIDGVSRVLRGADGGVRGFLKIGQDVTEWRKAEQERDRLLEAVLRSEERYMLVSRATNDVIWDWDLATDELTWNEALSTTFGYAPGAVPPTIDFWYAHIHPDDRDRVVHGIHAAIEAGGSAWADEYRFRRVDGRYITVFDRGVVARDVDGRATRMIGSMLDITEREELLASEREARAEAEAANRAKADFLASMSHELRTPLNAIGGYVDLLDLGIHGPLTHPQREALARVTANQRHLLTLINDVLAFAKLEAGQVEFDLRPLAACELLSGVEPLVAPLAHARGIALSVQECDPAVGVLADEERVRQILLNLVGNAIKFTQAGGWVVLTCEDDGAWVDVHVRDSGPGISAEKQQRIFDPFVQVDRRLNQPHEGVGLGLAISRDLAEAMGGALDVESTEGEGSTFTLRLPSHTSRASANDR